MNYEKTPEDEVNELYGLRLTAPESTFVRFRRRSSLMQGGKLLLESQVTGFWLVLDTLLKLLFRVVPLAKDTVHHDRTGENA